jgi:hypothetical protein
MPTTTAARLDVIAARLSAIEALIEARVPPHEIRTAIEEGGATAESVHELAEAAPQVTQQLADIAAVVGAQMTDSELREELGSALFVTQQLISIMQGTRTEIVEMRGTLRRLAALLEQSLRARVDDEEWHRTGIERRSEERRKASGF